MFKILLVAFAAGVNFTCMLGGMLQGREEAVCISAIGLVCCALSIGHQLDVMRWPFPGDHEG